MDLRRSIAVLIVAGCSGKKPPVVEDARRATPDSSAHDASNADASAGSAVAVITSPTTGDISVRVEWPDMPRELRVSPGPNRCGGTLAAQAVPTTTWGVADVVVFVEGVAPPASKTARVVARPCAIAPRVAVGTSVAIASSADRPLRLSLARAFATSNFAAVTDTARSVALPIAGHEAIAELADGIYKIVETGERVDEAWLVAAPAVLTDASGTVVIKDVAPGTHTVRVWLPPRGKLAGRSLKGLVDVLAGELAEVTLSLANAD